jgi:hypothetical protein
MVSSTFNVGEAIALTDEEILEAVDEVYGDLPVEPLGAERFDAQVAELARRIRERRS